MSAMGPEKRKLNTRKADGNYSGRAIEPYPVRPRREKTQVRTERPAPAQRQRPAPDQKTVRQRPPQNLFEQWPEDSAATSGEKKKGRSPKKENENAQRRRISRGELRRRRRRRRILAIVLTLLLVTAGSILSVTVLFTVKNMRVENLDKTVPANTGIYTEDAILGALAIPMEENMFHFSAKEREEAMSRTLPYLETIRVRRSLPSTVVVQVEPAQATWAVWQPGGWLVLSRGLKIMEQTAQPQEGLPVIYGLEAESILPGTFFAVRPQPVQPVLKEDGTVNEDAQKAEQLAQQQQADTKLADLRQLMKLLEETGLYDGVTAIDLREENENYFVYQNRIKILLGTFNNLEYKLGAVAKLVKNESGEFLGPSDKGILDVSHQLDDQVVRIPFDPVEFTVEPPQAGPEIPQDSEEAVPPQADGETNENEPAETPEPQLNNDAQQQTNP